MVKLILGHRIKIVTTREDGANKSESLQGVSQ